MRGEQLVQQTSAEHVSWNICSSWVHEVARMKGRTTQLQNVLNFLVQQLQEKLQVLLWQSLQILCRRSSIEAATTGTVISLLTSEAKMDAKRKKNFGENGVLYH